MSTTHSQTDNSTDPRDDYIHIGVDQEGASHCYRTTDESIFAIDNGEVIHHFDLDGRSVNTYIDHVAEARGWQSRQLYKGMASALFSSLE